VNLHDLAAALWPPDSTKEHFGMPAPKTVNNIVSRARTLVGRDRDGAHRLKLVEGGYVLSPSVTSDWGRFQALVGRARSSSALDKAGLLRQALELVEGTPLTGCLDSPFFEWASSEQLQHTIVAAVVDAAEDVARLCLDSGETQTVLWAVELGVKMDPTREQLYQCWMHALGRSADVGEVTDVWRRLCSALQKHIDPGQCPSLDSQEVYRSYLMSADTIMKST
jgi:DNA-binding SARP family transcriptional activator